MLAVVEHEQRVPIAQRLEQGVPGGANAVAPHAQRVGHVVRDQLGIGQGSELHPTDAVRVAPARAHAAGHLERQARLAGAAGTGEGEEPGALQQVLHGSGLALAPDERGQLRRRRRAHRRLGCRQALDECRHAAEPVGGRLGERPAQCRGHGFRDTGRKIGDAGRLDREVAQQHPFGRCAGEGRAPGQHFVQHAGERVLIGPPVQVRFSQRLLRAHVVGRPHQHARLCQGGAA